MGFIVRGATAAVALAFVLALASATHVQAQALGPLIRVGAGPDDPSTPLIYAAQAGLYRQAGLNVELEKVAGGAVAAAAIAGGSLEIGKSNPVSVVTAIGKGLPFTIIGSIANYDSDHPDQALIVSTNAPVKTAKDLAGQTFATITLQDIGMVAVYAWLAQRGVDWHTVKFVEMPATSVLAAMDENRIVGSNVNEPFFSAFMRSGRARIMGYPFDVIGKRFPEAVMFANANWVAQHRDLVVRFLQVTQQASIYVAAHENEMVPLLAQFGGVDPATYANIRHTNRRVAIAPADVQPVIDFAAKYNLIPQDFSAQQMICTCALRR